MHIDISEIKFVNSFTQMLVHVQVIHLGIHYLFMSIIKKVI